MAAPVTGTSSVPQDTLITIKISVNDNLKKLKLPLRDLSAQVLPDKLRHCLNIKPDQQVVFERFSDSVGGYIVLDPSTPHVFKTLVRAAKAKLKLRLKATVMPMDSPPNENEQEQIPPVQEPSTVIVSTPVYQAPSRESVAVDRRSVGSGIFQFREARASHQTLVNDEAPVPKPFDAARVCALPLRGRAHQESEAHVHDRGHAWSVYCNMCDEAVADTHFHCSMCDGGDYDLCEKCVSQGKLCPGDGHWLIKRSIVKGKVVASTTERVGRKILASGGAHGEKEGTQIMPGAFHEDTKTLAEEPTPATRTCNCCVVVLPEREFVTCQSCPDYDLCIECLLKNQHGHHPAHGFIEATSETILGREASKMLGPGRNAHHTAICDGCEQQISGVRHKCLSCPDWDFCNDCVKNAGTTHPRHRFAAIYAPMVGAYNSGTAQRHYGIFCDGPLCSGKSDQSYIVGVRYKCAVCHDTDFCASCEALPSHSHNRTHPLIKFKTAVRNVSIQTMSEDVQGGVRTLGDQRESPSHSGPQGRQAAIVSEPSQVQTVADLKLTEPKSQTTSPGHDFVWSKDSSPTKTFDAAEEVPASLLNAHFVRDTISDGLPREPLARFTQIWTLKNPGPYAWPAGCSVRFVGGDDMLNVDNNHVVSAEDLTQATESNVVGREVQVGEEVAFKVILKAPARLGQAISYWRLKAADGTAFGHRLWCHVEVRSQVETSSIPNAPQALTDAQMMSMLGATPSSMQDVKNLQGQDARLRLQQELMSRPHYPNTAALWSPNAGPSVPPQINGPFRPQINVPAMVGQPAAYTPTAHADITSRVSAMRQMQQARREHLQAEFDKIQRNRVDPSNVSWMPRGNVMQPILRDSIADVEKARKDAARLRAEGIKAKILRAREMKVATANTIKAKDEELQQKEVKTGEDAKETKEDIVVSAPLRPAPPAGTDVDGRTVADLNELPESLRRVESLRHKKSKALPQNEEEEMHKSQMVFPKLEKESPSSSTYASASSSAIAAGTGKAAYVENDAGEVERSAGAVMPEGPLPPSPVSDKDGYEDLTDLEVLSADGEQSEDDGFLTDEEYDILDASDRETVASP